MHILSFQVCREGHLYFLEPLTGILLKKKYDGKSKDLAHIEIKVKQSLQFVTEPYALQKVQTSYPITSNLSSVSIRLYAKFLIKLCKISFSLSRLLLFYNFKAFENSADAIIAFRRIFPNSVQKDLCLPRAIFAASTSKKFKEKGVIFVGVFLPSKSMHAWVIEDGMQPDPYDNMWINFQPVAAIW